jgi:hypothetical protein
MAVTDAGTPRPASAASSNGPTTPFRFELADNGAATRLRFRHDYAAELSDDYYGSYNFNWGYYLESLCLYCETGAGKPYAA